MFGVSKKIFVVAALVVGGGSTGAQAAIDTTPIVNISGVASIKVFEFNGAHPGGYYYSGGGGALSADGMTFGISDPRLMSQTALPGSYDYFGTPNTQERFDVFLSDQNGDLNTSGHCVTVHATSPANLSPPGWTSFNLGGIWLMDASDNPIRHFDVLANAVGIGPNYQADKNHRAVNGVNHSATTMGRTEPGGPPMSLTLCLSAPATPEWVGNQRGMTFGLQAQQAPGTDTVHVGCPGTGGFDCKPQLGDTPCSTPLPIACFRPGDASQPAGVPASTPYHEWSGGTLDWTEEMPAPTTLSEANNKCVSEFGADWRVAEFHDGWGWHFWAYGNPPASINEDVRFWTDINDQANGVCWDRNQ